ncbi:MAG: glycosyltransferase family 39 protein [Candidatus Nanoarchaeia archaeon]|nr:glycosyltransferase family 39 protein [Candidatus Nanoarchaeia archaeon]
MSFEQKTKEFLKDNENKLLVLLISFAVIIRLYYFFKVGSQPIWWDEGDYLAVAKGFVLHWQGQEWWSHFSGIRPMFMPIIWAFFFLINSGELVMRFFTLLVPSVISVYLIYAIGIDLYNKKVGLISGLILSVYWVHLFYTFRLLTDVPALFFGLLSIYFFWCKYITKNENKGLYYAILFGVLGFTVRFPLALIPISYPIYLFAVKKFELLKDKTFWYSMFFGLGLLIVYFLISSLFGSYITGAFKFYFGESAISTNNLLTNNLNQVGTMTFSFLGSDVLLKNIWFLTFIVGFFVFLQLILGFDIFLKQKDKKMNANFFVLIWITLQVLFYAVIIRAANDRWLLMLMPPIFFMSANGILTIYNYIKKYSKEVAIFILIALLFGGLYQNLTHANDLIEMKKTTYNEEKLAGLFIKDDFKGTGSPKIITASVVQIGYYSEGYTYSFYSNETISECYDPYGNLIKNETCEKKTEDLFNKKVKEINPDYLIIHVFEPVFTPQWAYTYPDRHRDELQPIQGYFADAAKTQPLLIIYKYKK